MASAEAVCEKLATLVAADPDAGFKTLHKRLAAIDGFGDVSLSKATRLVRKLREECPAATPTPCRSPPHGVQLAARRAAERAVPWDDDGACAEDEVSDDDCGTKAREARGVEITPSAYDTIDFTGLGNMLEPARALPETVAAAIDGWGRLVAGGATLPEFPLAGDGPVRGILLRPRIGLSLEEAATEVRIGRGFVPTDDAGNVDVTDVTYMIFGMDHRQIQKALVEETIPELGRQTMQHQMLTCGAQWPEVVPWPLHTLARQHGLRVNCWRMRTSRTRLPTNCFPVNQASLALYRLLGSPEEVPPQDIIADPNALHLVRSVGRDCLPEDHWLRREKHWDWDMHKGAVLLLADRGAWHLDLALVRALLAGEDWALLEGQQRIDEGNR